MLLVGHEREEGVPAQVGNIHIEHLKPQWYEGEVDQLKRWPHETV